MARPTASKTRFAQGGMAALKAGDYATAEVRLMKAVKLDRRNAELRLNLAIAHQKNGYIDDAARELTEALAISPANHEAIKRLSSLASRFQVEDSSALNAAGLRAAISNDTPNLQPVINLALQHLTSVGELAEALARASKLGFDEAASQMLSGSTDKALKDDLLLKVLANGKVTSIALERLLTSLRKILATKIPPDTMNRDKALFPFVLALVGQCRTNEYVWPVSDEEAAAVASLDINKQRLLAGDIEQAWKLCLQLLYGPMRSSSIAEVSRADLSKVRPKALAADLCTLADDHATEAELAKSVTRISVPGDDVGKRVAQQYEASPYPRWTSIVRRTPGSQRRALATYFNDEELAFMDRPFDVLIAGCGTGQHAAQAASGYGTDARVLAIDISVASLAYGKRMCASHGLGNLEFAQADILNLEPVGRTFDIIESVGVLHHMDDPFAGWRSLIDQLKPGGLMYLGFYSAVSRRNIAALRQEEIYPGAGCSDADARSYRQALTARAPGEPGSELIRSQDFYSLSEFRDLLLHVNEHRLTLAQIAEFLEASDLQFRGFTLDPLIHEKFRQQFPDDGWPGRLENWAALEEKEQTMFDGMYRFWCRRRQ